MTSHVDLSTGKIYGCKKGSWAWYHEVGHIKFNETKLSGDLKIYQSISSMLWMFSITIGLLNRHMIIIALPLWIFYLGVDLYEEMWCNNYAKLNYKKRRDGS